MLWQRALRKVVKMWRHQRMWNVHNAWFATQPAPAEAAGPPAQDTERMDVGNSATRAAAPADEQPRARAEGGLRATATEFAPGLPMAEVVAAWHGAVKLSAGRWQVTWHDLSNELARRSEEELTSRPWHPWPETQVAGHACPSDTYPSDSDDMGKSGWLSDGSD